MNLFDRFRAWLGAGRSEATPAPALPSTPVAPSFEWEGLRPLLRAAGFTEDAMWAKALARPMQAHGILGPRRVAAFLATAAHESGGGERLEENMRYSARRLMAVWPKRFPTLESAMPYAWDASDPDREDIALANLTYGHRLGNEANGVRDDDGWRFRGRGLIGLTGAANYREAADALGLPLVTQPDIAADPTPAAAIAAWWWASRGCNALADTGDVRSWRRRVNGGLIGLDDVEARYRAVMAQMGAEVLDA